MTVSSFKTREKQVKIFDASLTRGWTAWRRPFGSWREPWLRSVFIHLQSSSTQTRLPKAALCTCQMVRPLEQRSHQSHRSRPLWVWHLPRFLPYTTAESCSDAAWAVFLLVSGWFPFQASDIFSLHKSASGFFLSKEPYRVKSFLRVSRVINCYPSEFRGILALKHINIPLKPHFKFLKYLSFSTEGSFSCKCVPPHMAGWLYLTVTLVVMLSLLMWSQAVFLRAWQRITSTPHRISSARLPCSSF